MKPQSASSIDLFLNGCQARWGAKYIEGLREPESEQQAEGKLIHAQMEAYGTKGINPTHPLAVEFLAWSPRPHEASWEREFHFSLPHSPMIGFIDLSWFEHEGNTFPVVKRPGEAMLIQDWKTTKDLKYAKTQEELEENIQALLYAFEGFNEIGARSVRARWIYGSVKTHKVKPIIVDFDRNKTIDTVLGKYDPCVKEIQQLLQIRPKWTELPKNTGFCFSFNRLCPRHAECKPETTTQLRKPEMADFMKTMDEKYPEIPMPPVERGTINPWEAPDPVCTPEQAAHVQGVDKVEAPAAIDGFDAMDRDALKALCVKHALLKEGSRNQAPSMRALLRNAKIAAPTSEFVPDGAPSAQYTRVESVTIHVGGGMTVLGNKAPPVAEVPEVPEIPDVPEVVIPDVEPPVQFGDVPEILIDGVKLEIPAGSTYHAQAPVLWQSGVSAVVTADGVQTLPVKPRARTIYVNCYPVNGNNALNAESLVDISDEVNKALCAKNGVADWGLIKYTAQAEFAIAVKAALVASDCDLIVESTTREYAACIHVILPLFKNIVRAL